jgi:hypothetical protein
MIVIDSNSLVVLLVGIIDPKLISTHKRTSIYTPQDFLDLLQVIREIENLIVLPNVWTEVDNLLNNFSGNYKWIYVNEIKNIINKTSEKYLQSKLGVDKLDFFDIGLTDSLIIELGKECDFIITSDSELSDFAIANGIKVYDMVKHRNEHFE